MRAQLKALANFSDTRKNNMILLTKYFEPSWLAALLFLILGAAAFIALFIAERPESDDEKELLSKYRKSFDRINQR